MLFLHVESIQQELKFYSPCTSKHFGCKKTCSNEEFQILKTPKSITDKYLTEQIYLQ